MANPEHFELLKQGVKAWNEWRSKNPGVKPDLGEAYLPDARAGGVKLRRMNLSETDFHGVDFSLMNLSGANLRGSNLDNTNFGFGDLRDADLSGASLVGARMHNANLTGIDLCDANLQNADLSLARLLEARLVNANLRNAKLAGALMIRTELANARLGGATLFATNLMNADVFAADLSGADLTGATFVSTNLENANLSNSRVFGVSVWQVKLAGAIQLNLIVTPSKEPDITVDNLEIAQLVYLLLSNQKIRDFIDTVARKAVLILGRFGEHKPVLEAIRGELRKRDYLPILFDFKPPATRNVRETVRTLAHLSRFIIADITEPNSIPLELEAIVPELRVPVQPILVLGHKEFSMFQDLRETYHWVLATHQYTGIADLLASLGDKVITPAEQKARELEKR